MNDVASQIASTFADAGARGYLHARAIGGDAEVAVGADEPVVLASVFKIAVAVAFAREVAAGRLDGTERARVTSRYRIGGIGTAGCTDAEVRIAAKTGTLPAVRNEAGVLTYPDGHRYAVAVFTHAESLAERQPAVDAAIGRTARLAVDHLRSLEER